MPRLSRRILQALDLGHECGDIRIEANGVAPDPLDAGLPVAQAGSYKLLQSAPACSKTVCRTCARTCWQPAPELVLDARVEIRTRRVGHVSPGGGQTLPKVTQLVLEAQATFTRLLSAISSPHANSGVDIVGVPVERA